MYCAKLKKFAYQCEPKRLKRLKGEQCFSFFPIIPSHLYPSCNQYNHAVKNSNNLQHFVVPFLYRAKNLNHIGLLALFFCRLKWNY